MGCCVQIEMKLSGVDCCTYNKITKLFSQKNHRVPRGSYLTNLGCPALTSFHKSNVIKNHPKTKVSDLWHPGCARAQP